MVNENTSTPSATVTLPQPPPMACSSAHAVIGAPARPSCIHAPVTMIDSAVRVTMIRVSMKVWVIDTMAWRTGWSVIAEAAAMAPVPRPDSLEKMPRATPICTARITAEPAKPPAAALPLNASVKTSARVAGRRSANTTSTNRLARMNTTHISGTTPAANRAMLLIPPRITAAAQMAMAKPLQVGEMFQVASSWPAAVLAWTMLPMPNAAIAPNRANAMPRVLPQNPPMPLVR